MATRRFCDLCDNPLKPEDDVPLVRVLEYPDERLAGQKPNKAFAYVQVTNENNHPLTDVCIGCKLSIVTNGELAPTTVTIATLQPQVAADTPVPTPFFKLPEKPPQVPLVAQPTIPVPEVQFEPSLPARKPPEQQPQ